MKQQILMIDENFHALNVCLKEKKVCKLLLVCGSSLRFLKIYDYFQSGLEQVGIEVVRFSNFQPNPLYESVIQGVQVFRENHCDAIFAVGGGSALDVAKCIKLYANMDPHKNYLLQTILPNDIPLFAMPTTAGTGSEVTRYAVIYYQGEKQSVTHESCIPSVVVMDPTTLETLPLYQKKAAMLDALCHAVESWWSVNSTEESRKYSREAIRDVLRYKDAYLANESGGNAKMLWAARCAGKAINITQTTAGHAMCYKLTGLYGIAHGHAAALCVSQLWPYMLEHMEDCADPRGREYLLSIFDDLAAAFDSVRREDAAEKFQKFVDSLELEVPVPRKEDYAVLNASVNPVRLKNNPVPLDEKAIGDLYKRILR